MNSNPPSVFSPHQVDVCLNGRPQGRFQAWLPTVRHLCQALKRADRSPPAQQDSTQGSAVAASGRAKPSCLGGTALPWTQSPPTRVIPTTLDAPVDLTGMGKTSSWSVSNSVGSCLCFSLGGSECSSLKLSEDGPSSCKSDRYITSGSYFVTDHVPFTKVLHINRP